jgi:hypothetical protein
VEVSAEFMTPEETPLLGLACWGLVLWRIRAHLLNNTKAHAAVNNATASYRSMRSRRTSWQVPALRTTQVQYIINKSCNWF